MGERDRERGPEAEKRKGGVVWGEHEAVKCVGFPGDNLLSFLLIKTHLHFVSNPPLSFLFIIFFFN